MIRPRLLLTILLAGTINSYGMQRAIVQKLTSVPVDYCLFMGMYLAFSNEKNLAFAWEKRPWRRHRALIDAHPLVKDFVYAQLDPHQDATLIKNLKIKLMHDELSSMSTLTNILFIDIKHNLKLAALLEFKKRGGQLTQEQQNMLAYYAVVARHEIGHLKNHDSYYIRLFSPAASLILHAGTWALAKRFSIDHYYKPSHFAPSQTESNLFKGGLFFVIAGFAHYFVHHKLYRQYEKHMETRSYTYAFEHTRDPRELRGYAQHVKTVKYKKLADQIINQVIKEIGQYTSSEPSLKIYSHYLHYKFLKEQPSLKKSPHSPEALAAFRSWLQQPLIIDTLEKMRDPIHETYAELTQRAEKAAELLENYQKKYAAA